MRVIKNIPTNKLSKVVEDLAYETSEHINCVQCANGLWKVEYSTEKKNDPDGWEGDLINQL